ncbi:MAG: hypothetical protein AB7F31_05145 [Parachlamydiales bacterium]
MSAIFSYAGKREALAVGRVHRKRERSPSAEDMVRVLEALASKVGK